MSRILEKLPSLEEWCKWIWESLNQFFVNFWDLYDWIREQLGIET